jgi:hypothetical protein
MAKGAAAQKPAEQPAPKSDGAQKVAKEKKEPKIQTIKLLRVVKDDEKIGGTQVKGILKCLAENGKTMTTEEIRAKLGSYITTKQDPLRVFMFYRKSLLDQGLISIAD